MSSLKVLVAIDFDHTLIDCNSDLHIKNLAPNGYIPTYIESLSSGPDGWTPFMRELFKFLYHNNVKPDDYFQCLSQVRLVAGMSDLLETMHKSNEYEVIILSDANSVFINHILRHNGLQERVKEVFTNPANFNENGCLEIQEYHVQNWCKICARNICKGWMLESHKSRRESEGVKFQKVVFIGDGYNDICPSLKLKRGDYVFARKGYRLLKKLEKMPAKDVSATVFAWESGKDIANVLLTSRN